jgi:alkanesulfonate monooxygenase
MPGETETSERRYQRSREVVEILKACWTEDRVNHQGEFYSFTDVPTGPVKPYQINGGPLLYFGGMSEAAMDLCARHCDVFLMWPETEDRLAVHIKTMSEKAAAYGRTIDFGLRVHMIVRETEGEARDAASRLVSRLDDEVGRKIRERALDSKSYGVARQAEMRDLANDEGYIEPHLWTGIGRARSGCSCALVGNPDQILAQLERYMDMGIRAFIFSGYPHRSECDLFARYVLPRLPRVSMPIIQGRVPHASKGLP